MNSIPGQLAAAIALDIAERLGSELGAKLGQEAGEAAGTEAGKAAGLAEAAKHNVIGMSQDKVEELKANMAKVKRKCNITQTMTTPTEIWGQTSAIFLSDWGCVICYACF